IVKVVVIMNVSHITIIIKVVVEQTMATKVAMVVTIMVVTIMVALVRATRFTAAAFLGARTNNGYLILRQIDMVSVKPRPSHLM
ncbi:MAG TPA: hypothetical protein VE971_04455, partial [Candidatus Eisenbacteria bacterium]|nr:hypothetical protein [Candidatus Eisenbacteria bacterium]